MNEWPSHRSHEQRGMKPIHDLCHRLRAPKAYREFALKVCEFHLHCHRINELKPTTILKLLENLDGFRNTEVIENFVLCCKADMRGRTGFEKTPYFQGDRLRDFHEAARCVDAKGISTKYEGGTEIGAAIRRARLSAIVEEKKRIA